MRDIAEQTKLPVEDVEYLLMKSLSVRHTVQNRVWVSLFLWQYHHGLLTLLFFFPFFRFV